MNKQQLASKIWESANKMRSKIEANEYKDYILGFMFYKFLSDKEINGLKKNGWTEEDLKFLDENDAETVEFCQKNFGYFISYGNLFSTWLKMGKDFDVSNVRDALSAFNRLISETHKKVFEKIFNTLDTGLSKLGDSSGTQTKAISDLIQLIKDIPTSGRQDYDVLGFIYEYLISNFAANAGKKAGEFYTPHEVSLLMSEIVAEHLKDRNKIEIYDPTSGSGSLLINIGRSVAKRVGNSNKIKYYAQELKENTYNLTRMNLVMRGIEPSNICTRNGDTLEDDWPYFDEAAPTKTYNPLYVDAVVSNPPYSQAWDPTDKESDARYKRYGLAPKTKADYAFLLHDLFHVKPDGIMAIVLPHGVLFRGGEEEKIRTNLIENNNIDAIIGLPANIFFGTGIPTIIMVLKQHRTNTDVLIIDASKGYTKSGKNNKLRASDIKKIVDTVSARAYIEKYSKKVSRDEIRANGYNLNIPRYVDSSEEAETWDIYASIFGGVPKHEIDRLQKFWEAFPSLKSEIFNETSTPYSSVKSEDVKSIVENNSYVKSFIQNHKDTFDGFENDLNSQLIKNVLTVNRDTEETTIAENIFARLKNTPLIDKYSAYQLLSNKWAVIETDLEIIQTEGFAATKLVDPKMVIKKEKGKEVEVQDGWIGHVIPFEVVQSSLLKEQTEQLKKKENIVTELDSQFNELAESFTEEDKVSFLDLFDDEGNVVNAAIAKTVKTLKKHEQKYDEDSAEWKVIRLGTVSAELKSAKRTVKELSYKLEEQTKTAIENLTDEQVNEMLYLKWIKPLYDSIADLPALIIDELINNVNTLAKKYNCTMIEIENQINETEKAFADMIDELEGSEFDMLGLKELQKMLKGEKNG